MGRPLTPRVEPRFTVCKDRTVQAAVEWMVDGETTRTVGEFRDLSRNGARLTVADKPPVDDEINLQLLVPDLEFDLTVSARVCWTETAGQQGWTLGCKLEGAVPDEVLQRLATLGYVDRRTDRRQEVDVAAVARWELEADGDPSVHVTNLSPTGFRLRSDKPGRPGARLLLTIDNEGHPDAVVSATAVWQLKEEDAYYIGCSYSDPQAFAALQLAVVGEQLVETAPKPSLGLTMWGWVGLLAAVVWAYCQLWR